MVILQPANEATPELLVLTGLAVQVNPAVLVPVVVRVTDAPDTRLAKASVTVTAGWVVNVTPAVCGVDGCVEKVIVATAAALTVTELLVALIAPSVPTKV